MCKSILLQLLVFSISLKCGFCDDEIETPSIKDLIQKYKSHLESTMTAEQSERNSTKRFLDQFQVTLVKKLTDYRLQMVMHRNHSFGEYHNEKWAQCLKIKSNKIEYLDEVYSEDESPCVLAAQTVVNEKKHAIRQIVKEIRQWRKGFRYLNHLCKENNPRNKANTGACLVVYMKRDSYDNTIARLLEMLDITQADFKNQITDSLQSLDDCLHEAFSKYLHGVRMVKTMLNKCYKKKNTVDIRIVDCPHISKLNCVNSL